MISDGRSFDDTVCPDVHMVTYFHRIIIKVSTVCFVRWSRYEIVS